MFHSRKERWKLTLLIMLVNEILKPDSICHVPLMTHMVLKLQIVWTLDQLVYRKIYPSPLKSR
jgi:hypothetical protein